MWQRFTERARKAVFNAQEEAHRFGDGFVSTEHLLLGLTCEEDSTASLTLVRLGLPASQLRGEIEGHLKAADGSPRPAGEVKLTPRTKQVIDFAHEEARSNNRIGTEHLLLGILREGRGVAAQILGKHGVDVDTARREVSRMQDHEVGVIGTPAASVRNTVKRNTLGLQGQSLTSIAELTPVQALEIINVALAMKVERLRGGELVKFKRPKTLAMIYEKPSLRTRVTFETAMVQLDGHSIFLGPQDIQMGHRETPADVAANLSRWVDGIIARVFRHETIIQLDEHSSIPVINGLSDLEHPCQALADLMTFYEHKCAFEGKRLAWVGDGNNVCNSVMLLGALVGMDIAIACPKGYEPSASISKRARELAQQAGSSIEITNDPAKAVKGADAVYTDVWASMGQESEAEERARIMGPFQLNQELLKKARPDAIVLHCLPAKRGEEITAEILDGPQSVVLDQAENRLHAQKALLSLLLGEG